MLKLSDEFHGPLRLSDLKTWLFLPGTVGQVTAVLSLDQDRIVVIVGNAVNQTVTSLEYLWSFKSHLCKEVTCSQLHQPCGQPFPQMRDVLGKEIKAVSGCFREAMKWMNLCDAP